MDHLSVAWVISRWELPTATFAWRPARCLADNGVNSLYRLTYPVGVGDEEMEFENGAVFDPALIARRESLGRLP